MNPYSSRHYQTDEALYANFTKQTGIGINRIEAMDDELIEHIRNEGAAAEAPGRRVHARRHAGETGFNRMRRDGQEAREIGIDRRSDAAGEDQAGIRTEPFGAGGTAGRDGVRVRACRSIARPRRPRRPLRQISARTLRRPATACRAGPGARPAVAVADVVGVMHAGRIEQLDTPYDLYHRPATRRVADFIGQGVFLPGTLAAECDGGSRG